MADDGEEGRTRAVLQNGVMYMISTLNAVDQLLHSALDVANANLEEDQLPLIYAAFDDLKQTQQLTKDRILNLCKTEAIRECLRAYHVNVTEVKMISLDNKDDTSQSLLIDGDKRQGGYIRKWLMEKLNIDPETETERKPENKTHDIQDGEQEDGNSDDMKNGIKENKSELEADLYFLFSEVLNLMMTNTQNWQEIMLKAYENFRDSLGSLASDGNKLGTSLKVLLDSAYPNIQRMADEKSKERLESRGKGPMSEGHEEITAYIGVGMDKLLELFCEQIQRLTFLSHELEVSRNLLRLLHCVEDCKQDHDEIKSIVEQLKNICL